MDSVHHIWCPLSSQEFQDLPDGAETTLTQIAVYQTDCGRRLFTELCDPDTRVLTELNKPEQGRQSFHHEAKGKKCCHSDGNTAENACQGGRQHHHGNGRCCHS